MIVILNNVFQSGPQDESERSFIDKPHCIGEKSDIGFVALDVEPF
jgi:hypothetical protein